ncbi:MAG TPA: SRPBCC family protein, partial [Terracidiphilus sp.]|nr:SRPBCC family protein [Terracidiphilus sp.]
SKHSAYTPGPAASAQVRKEGDKWTLILVRLLRHAPENVWLALTDPMHLSQWAPYEADQSLARIGASVELTWAGAPQSFRATVLHADAPRLLEVGDMRWELEPIEDGTRLTLWHNIDRRFIAWGAAGWHICLDVLDRRLAGDPIPRIAGPEAMQISGWKQLAAGYAQQFGVELPKGQQKPAQES